MRNSEIGQRKSQSSSKEIVNPRAFPKLAINIASSSEVEAEN